MGSGRPANASPQEPFPAEKASGKKASQGFEVRKVRPPHSARNDKRNIREGSFPEQKRYKPFFGKESFTKETPASQAGLMKRRGNSRLLKRGAGATPLSGLDECWQPGSSQERPGQQKPAYSPLPAFLFHCSGFLYT